MRRLGRVGLAASLVVAVAAGAWAAPDFAALQIQPYEPPKPAPAISLPDVAGKTWNLADMRGKVVLLFFWATW
jgi:cytochrome oxidase Cu insertion factor (SCO1/SenC/PrrC family)